MNKSLQRPMPLHQQPVYESNPSIVAPGAIAKTRRIKLGNEKRGMLVDEGTGEILGHGAAVAYEFEEVDKERFVKLYLAGLKNAVGLSKAGMEVFEMVYDQMRDGKDKDTVMLHAKLSTMSQPQFSRGLRELIDRGFLFRHPFPGMFWVNVKFMFNGDRLAFVKGYQLRGSARQLDLLDGVETRTQEAGGQVNDSE